MIGIARSLLVDEPFGADLKDTVHALDAATIDLCLSVFPWAPYQSTKDALKPHALLDLRGELRAFIPIRDGMMHEVDILDQLVPPPGTSSIIDRGLRAFARAPSRSG